MKWRRGCKIGCLAATALCLVVLGGTCLSYARLYDLTSGILEDDVGKVRRALALGADPNAGRPPSIMDFGSDRPIFMEAFIGQRCRPEIVVLLLKHGADPNYTDIALGTPLQIVCREPHGQGTAEVPELLLNHGASPNVRDRDGCTPLHICIPTSGWLDQATAEIVNVLLAHGADPNARDNVGQTPLHKAAGSYCMRPSVARQVITALVGHGADINARDNQGKTPLDHIGISGGAYIEDGISFMKQQGAVTGTGPFWGPSRE